MKKIVRLSKDAFKNNLQLDQSRITDSQSLQDEINRASGTVGLISMLMQMLLYMPAINLIVVGSVYLFNPSSVDAILVLMVNITILIVLLYRAKQADMKNKIHLSLLTAQIQLLTDDQDAIDKITDEVRKKMENLSKDKEG